MFMSVVPPPLIKTPRRTGLLFLLDMIFDLVIGFLPFYRKMFRPVIQQGTILDSLYREGYQNYQELPVFSVIYPLIRWLF